MRESSKRMGNKSLQNFKFAKFRFYLQPRDKIHLPYFEGSTLRGGFGHIFKEVVCISKERDCSRCILKGKCAYSYVFETICTDSVSVSYHSIKYPHPFVIEPLSEGKHEYSPNNEIVFNLVLVGKGIDYLPYFLFVYNELGARGLGRNRGKYTLRKVESVLNDKFGSTVTIYTSESATLLDTYEIRTFAEIEQNIGYSSCKSVSLQFMSPTRIVYRGELTIDIDFEIFIRNLLRRTAMLSELHCGQKLNLDFKRLLEKAKRAKTTERNLFWREMERYSSRQREKMKLGGFVGNITFKGDLGEFISFIKLGEYIHLGKATSFGLGKYRIIDPQRD